MIKQAQNAMEADAPVKLSYGFICGFSSGFAMKKVGKVAAVTIGKCVFFKAFLFETVLWTKALSILFPFVDEYGSIR